MLIRVTEGELNKMPKTEAELRLAIITLLSEQPHEMRTAVLGPMFSPDHEQHQHDLAHLEDVSLILSRGDWVVLDAVSLVNCLEIMHREEDEFEAAQKINDFFHTLIIDSQCFDALHFLKKSDHDILATILNGAANRAGIPVYYLD